MGCFLLVCVPVVLLACFIPMEGEFARPVLVTLALLFSGLYWLIFSVYALPKSLDRQTRRMYGEGANKGVLGQHEIEIDASGLWERSEVSETRHAWRGIERIEESDDYAFIYVTSMSAHVIPKQSVTQGDPETFLLHARKLWRTHNVEIAEDD